tara:strand:+ start:71820 stop:72383 length:564 start_codon:yes stop_codon:yes gene_type:complete
MVSFSTSEFKAGLKILIDGEPCVILEEEFNKPGKGQAFSKIKYRNLLSGKVVDKTCKVGETLKSADVEEIEMQFLYSDEQDWFFMNQTTFEQISIPLKVIDEQKDWIIEESICRVILWNQKPISITPPNFINLKVVETDPGVKGDTASGGNKPATLSNGKSVKVPLFVSEGETITVDTRTGEYQGRN